MTLRTPLALGATQDQLLALLLLAAAALLLTPLAALPGLALAGALLLARLPRAALTVLALAVTLALLGVSIADSHRPPRVSPHTVTGNAA